MRTRGGTEPSRRRRDRPAGKTEGSAQRGARHDHRSMRLRLPDRGTRPDPAAGVRLRRRARRSPSTGGPTRRSIRSARPPSPPTSRSRRCCSPSVPRASTSTPHATPAIPASATSFALLVNRTWGAPRAADGYGRAIQAAVESLTVTRLMDLSANGTAAPAVRSAATEGLRNVMKSGAADAERAYPRRCATTSPAS